MHIKCIFRPLLSVFVQKESMSERVYAYLCILNMYAKKMHLAYFCLFLAFFCILNL